MPDFVTRTLAEATTSGPSFSVTARSASEEFRQFIDDAGYRAGTADPPNALRQDTSLMRAWSGEPYRSSFRLTISVVASDVVTTRFWRAVRALRQARRVLHHGVVRNSRSIVCSPDWTAFRKGVLPTVR